MPSVKCPAVMRDPIKLIFCLAFRRVIYKMSKEKFCDYLNKEHKVTYLRIEES